jgi:histidinol-phosphate aminotransferase
MNLDETLLRINPGIRSLKAYHLSPDDVEVKLNQNENPFDWPAQIKEELASFVVSRPWNRYPDFIPEKLKTMLAQYAGVKPENILAGNGSNEMLLVLMLSLTGTDQPLIICQPTFTVYRLLASGMGRSVEQVFLDSSLRYDTGAILDACRKNPAAALLICTPNNPTGSALTEAETRLILETHKGFVILDQAYVEFGGYSAMQLINEYPNLIVTRTFSKAFGGAGLRLGYLAGHAGVVSEMNKIKLPYNINFFSDRAACALLANENIVRERVQYITKERDRLYAFLLGFSSVTAYESDANFILIRTGGSAALGNALRKDGILIRDVSSYPKLENCLRISVGTAEENNRLMNSLSRLLAR